MTAIARLIDSRAPPLWIGVIAGLIGVLAAFLNTSDPSQQALLAARWTARTAVFVFLVTFLASSMVRLWPSDLTKAILRRRRQWGLGFAIAHSIHLAALAVNVLIYRPRPWESVIAGGVAYAMIYIMAITSTNTAQRKLGKWWRYIHKFGIYYIWFIFTASYTLRATGDDPAYYLEGRIMLPIMFGALLIRIWASYKKRSRV